MVNIPWSVRQYRDVFNSLYQESDENTQIAIAYRLDLLSQKGNQSRPPHTKELRNGIFELRVKGRRFLFYFGPEKEIVFVYSFKKGEKLHKALHKAEENRKVIQDQKEGTHEISI